MPIIPTGIDLFKVKVEVMLPCMCIIFSPLKDMFQQVTFVVYDFVVPGLVELGHLLLLMHCIRKANLPVKLTWRNM